MERYISLNIHTEALHDDKHWQRTKSVLDYFFKHNIKASWFFVNPSFVGYKAMGFDEKKWKDRLKILGQRNQSIEQHTHFYKGKEGVAKGVGYDLGQENVLKRIREDREWLRGQGYEVKGFLSGTWKINEEILSLLAREGYKYDLSINNLDLEKNLTIREFEGLMVVPATASIKRLFLDLILFRSKRRFLEYNGVSLCTIHFHDFDLDTLNYYILLFLILISPIFNFKFISMKDFYEKIKK